MGHVCLIPILKRVGNKVLSLYCSIVIFEQPISYYIGFLPFSSGYPML